MGLAFVALHRGALSAGHVRRLTEDVALNVEPKFGVLGGDFIFLPQANLVVGI